MIDYLEDLQRIALTALFNPAFLFLLIVLFLAGKYLGKLTKGLSWWKILLILYFGLFLYEPVRDAGPILGGIFVLGIASNHVRTFFSALSWAGNLGDLIYAFRYRSAFEDIKRREKKLEERERELRDEARRQAYRQQEQEQSARAGWQDEAKGFRGKTEGKKASGADGKRKQHTSGSKRQEQARSYLPPPQTDKRAQHLRTLGLKPDRDYSPA
ncbi:MAG: hypothetical protein ABJO72_02755 [Hyphomicrobiales bacterium]